MRWDTPAQVRATDQLLIQLRMCCYQSAWPCGGAFRKHDISTAPDYSGRCGLRIILPDYVESL